MPKLFAAALLAGSSALAGFSGFPTLPALPFGLHLPAAVERWLYNPRERTARAIESVRQGMPKAAVAPADTALRLAPRDPLARYNAGTAHLDAGDRRGATSLLDKAAQEAGAALAPAAWYNLGNARLGAGDAAGAVEAYKQALRRAPNDANAKFNLELALRQREQERLRAKAPREGNRGDREGEKGSAEKPGTNDPAERQNKSDASDPGQSPQKSQEPPQSPGEQPQRAGPDGRPLPRFRDQPEMSAQEAAALLQSVENLERQQRRRQAAQRARQSAAKGKDW
jgi:Ca-activated chloride channel family protein